MKLRIRQTKDYNEIHKLDAVVFDYNVHHPVTTSGSVWWIVYDGKTPVAYAGATHYPDKDRVYLCRAGVLPAYRGLGLQLKLIKLRLKWAKEKCKVGSVVTYTDQSNIFSSNNLIKTGFLLYSPDVPWGDEEGSLYWKKMF